jgi:hypothetical protein
MAALTPKVSIMTTYTLNTANPNMLLETLHHNVLAGLLPENDCYKISKLLTYRVQALIKQLPPKTIISLTISARQQPALRYVAFLLIRELVRITQGTEHSKLIAPTLVGVLQSPADLIDFLNIYWQETKQPLTKQVKKGLALALQKFDTSALAECSYKQHLKLRDILRLLHPQPKDAAQATAWQLLVANKKQPLAVN